jgi:Domain of Unknown Function (DUF928)
MKLARSPITSLCTITWTFVSFTSDPAIGRAQFYRPANNFFMQPSNQAKQKSPDFSGRGRPGPRKGGGSRGGCPLANPKVSENQKPTLTALIPVSNWGQTLAERPTFWFYIPYSSQEAVSGEFVLREKEGNNDTDLVREPEIYRISFMLPRTPGLVSFSIPPTKPSLEINKWYRWDFKLNCAPPSPASDLVRGWVQRIELTPELEKQLNAARGREYDVYANQLIWYDALARLAELRLNNPSDSTLSNSWKNLLAAKGVGLENLNEERFTLER